MSELVRVVPAGALSGRGFSAFLLQLDDAVAEGRTVVVDLVDVDEIDPHALEAVVEAHRYLRQHNGSVRIDHPSPEVRRLLQDLGLASLLAA